MLKVKVYLRDKWKVLVGKVLYVSEKEPVQTTNNAYPRVELEWKDGVFQSCEDVPHAYNDNLEFIERHRGFKISIGVTETFTIEPPNEPPNYGKL